MYINYVKDILVFQIVDNSSVCLQNICKKKRLVYYFSHYNLIPFNSITWFNNAIFSIDKRRPVSKKYFKLIPFEITTEIATGS